MPRRALLAHPGTQYSLHLARELHRLKQLDSFHTCLAVCADSGLARVLSPVIGVLGIERQWQNRLITGVPSEIVHTYPAAEIGAWWQMRRGAAALPVLRERNDRFQNGIPDQFIDSADVVVGFDTSAQILGARAKARGKGFILDRSIGHSRSYARLTKELKDRFPEWGGASDVKSESELSREDEEHQLASLIVVPSRFVAGTLVAHGVAPQKIRVNPFGTDTKHFHPLQQSSAESPLIFLFVGALTARKGLPLLLQAWQQIDPPDAELWIAGTGEVPAQARRDAPASVKWLGAISREKLPGLFRSASVFVFPSLFEGLAQVQVEAAACGLPIIATTASGGEDVVVEDQTGFILEPGNLDQLIESITRFIERPSRAREMGERVKASGVDWSWSRYGQGWEQILAESA